MNNNLRNSLPSKTHISRHPIGVLYEDDCYIVFDKPTGLLVIPTPKGEQNTLVNIANQQYSSKTNSSKLYPCHRIDRETSGVIIFAKGKRNQQVMMELFKARKVAKTYIAFVHGKIPGECGEFQNPIKDAHQKKFRKNQPAVSARTQYKVLKIKKQFSVVEVRPITGRTNQIRIHFSEAGYPLVGERKYAFARDYILKFRRVALHAAALGWIDPMSGKKISVQSELPKDMTDFVMNN